MTADELVSAHTIAATVRCTPAMREHFISAHSFEPCLGTQAERWEILTERLDRDAHRPRRYGWPL